MLGKLIAYLRGHGFDVDDTTLANGYGTNGRLWVLPESYDIEGVYDMEVYVCTAVGGPIEALARKVWTALKADGSPVGASAADFTFGTPPIAARVPAFEPADFCVISVQAGSDFDG